MWLFTWLISSSTLWRRWSIALMASTAEWQVAVFPVFSASDCVWECVLVGWSGFLRGFRGLEWSEGKRGAEGTSVCRTQAMDGNCEHTAHVGSTGYELSYWLYINLGDFGVNLQRGRDSHCEI